MGVSIFSTCMYCSSVLLICTFLPKEDQKGVKTVSIKTSGHEKSHYTVVLACCANGTKLPPMIIFKRKTLPKERLIFIYILAVVPGVARIFFAVLNVGADFSRNSNGQRNLS